MTPRHVDPIDEIQLLRRGLPSGAAATDAGTQTPPMGEVLTTPVSERREPAEAPKVVLPIGTRFGMMWLPERGKAKQEYLGTILEEIKRPGQSVMYRVKYDDYDEALFHDFARTKRVWRVIKVPKSQEREVRAKTRSLTTADAGAAATQNAEADAVGEYQPASNAGHLAKCMAPLAKCMAPEPGDEPGREGGRSVSARNKEAGKITPPTQETNKASQNTVDVHTDLGTAQYRVPATKREVMESPQREEWMEADRRALDAILRAGNKLVPVGVPEGKGVPIARTVTARRLKIDPATGRLAEKNAYKSRHALDGGYLKIQQEQMTGRQEEQPDADGVPATSTVVDDMTLKMFLAFAAKHDLELTKGDIGNAYAKAKSTRQLGYMHLPSTLRFLDEDGGPMCIELHTPIWGEREAGYEWQCTFAESILNMGWKSCEGVPAMYTFQKPDGGLAAMITIVDDFLIAERGDDISRATLALLKTAFKELTVQPSPDSFSGYKITRDRRSRAITMSMPQKIIEATRAHIPEALDGESKVCVLKGAKLMSVADGMEIDPLSKQTKHLSKQQKCTQSIIGSLKFIEKVLPEISVALHRLSCVMSAPPDEAYAVAKGVLYQAYLLRSNGITYGGDSLDEDDDEFVGIEGRAPKCLSASADATWGDGRNLYGVLLTYNRGAILHMTKKIRAIAESSHHSEAIATSKAAEQVTYAREVLRALQEPEQGATTIATDNRANQLVAHDATSAKRARHFLRQYWVLQQRIEAGDIAVRKLPTSLMPADFLTKWISGIKFKRSSAYATNNIAYTSN